MAEESSLPSHRDDDNKKPKFDKVVKLCLIGDSGVGKSCLLTRWTDNLFNESHIATVGLDFRFRTIMIGKYKVKVQIWDTAGQERFRGITSAYYRNAHGIILVYDISNRESFDHVEEWVADVHRNTEAKCSYMLVGNKADLEDSRQVPREVGQAQADRLNISFMETSAKADSGVDDAFTALATKSFNDTLPEYEKPAACACAPAPCSCNKLCKQCGEAKNCHNRLAHPFVDADNGAGAATDGKCCIIL